MIYNNANTSAIGRPVRVFDANGLEWKDCLEVDTETGCIIQYRRDAGGNYVIGVEGDLERETVYTSPPLLVVPIPQFSSGDVQ